jgi:hypothetical protein
MASETLIEDAIIEAKASGFLIKKGGTFHYIDNQIVACNALGAVLLKINKEELIAFDKGILSYNKDWLLPICDYLSVNKGWILRFIAGFNYSNKLEFIDHIGVITKDSTSRIANAIARKYLV